jgi:ABC-type transport system involved in cytochrome c biogenesis ATPase subunit
MLSIRMQLGALLQSFSSAFVLGPAGCGKTSLLRTVAAAAAGGGAGAPPHANPEAAARPRANSLCRFCGCISVFRA